MNFSQRKEDAVRRTNDFYPFDGHLTSIAPMVLKPPLALAMLLVKSSELYSMQKQRENCTESNYEARATCHRQLPMQHLNCDPRFGFEYLNSIICAVSVLPNHSLNRTHCGMRLKARHFILGL